MREAYRLVRWLSVGGGPVVLAFAMLMTPTAIRSSAAEPAPTPRTAEAGQATILSKEAYLTPPKAIADAVLASRAEIVTLTNLSPDGRKFLISKRDGLPPVERLGCPCVHLAELAFDPVACRSRDVWVLSAEAYELFDPINKKTVRVKSPTGARVGNAVWSPDGAQLAFFAYFPDATYLYVANTETGACRKVTAVPVLATLSTTLRWTRDGKRIQTVLLPDGGKRPVPKQPIATEPKVRVARDGKDPSRTYRYLLESPYQARLLEHLLTGQVAVIDVANGTITNIGEPAMIQSVSASPNADQFRVGTVKKPFSYYVPFTRFGSTEAIWNLEGKPVYTLADRNLRDTTLPPPPPAPAPTPKGGTAQPVQPKEPAPATESRRDLSWRPDGKGMSFLQLEPAPKDAKAVRKDRVMQWLPPFGKDDAKVVYETPHAISAVDYSADCRWLFLAQTFDGRRQITAVDLDNPKTTYVIDRAGTGFAPKKKDDTPPKPEDEEVDEQPGGFRSFGFASTGLMTHNLGGVDVVRVSSTGDVYISGSSRGPSANYSRPYIDAINIKTGKKTRLFEGKGDAYETIDAVDGDDIKRVFTTRQKSDVVPDSYMTELASGKVTKLTNNVDATPWFHQLKTERIRVTRVDGFKFWVRVTLPPKATGKLPALFWIYPREYADQAAYDRTAGRGSPTGTFGGRFSRPNPRSVAILTLAGYAVIEPDVPIVGPAEKFNDNYVPDLRNSLWAAIDELDKRGIIDRDRLACGGHSYGAFSTANALAHTPFFKAGIAGDGCYNRTLTSMSFQTERRQLWDARETYLEMSPLLWANRVNGALLMYHGMEDANVGTNPINSEAMFLALDGLGKDAALYMYPYEGHGPIAKETTLDMWARWLAWLDLHVKNPKKK